MPLKDLGTSLCVLVYHLYRKYKPSERAFRELSFRTRVKYNEADALQATTPSRLMGTMWFSEMLRRRAAMQEEIKRSHSNEVGETIDLVKSLYPNGCALSEFADAVQTCTSMLSFTVSESLIQSMIAKEGELLEQRHIGSLTAELLADTMVNSLLVNAFVPLHWWVVYPKGLAFASPKRIGIASNPPSLCVEYADVNGSLRHRTIHLGEHILANRPTGPLVRRIVETHDVLISEVQIQKSLIKLQRLMERGVSQKDRAPRVDPPKIESVSHTSSAAEQVPVQSAAAIQKTTKQEAQKADLGLLYRDPEKALENVDLNDADDVTLQEFKAAMDQKFKTLVLKPGDEGYVYDKRVEVKKPTQKSEWDDSDSDE